MESNCSFSCCIKEMKAGSRARVVRVENHEEKSIWKNKHQRASRHVCELPMCPVGFIDH